MNAFRIECIALAVILAFAVVFVVFVFITIPLGCYVKAKY